MLVTHWGLSGPVILRLSAWGARNLFSSDYRGKELFYNSVLLDFKFASLQLYNILVQELYSWILFLTFILKM